MTHRFLCRLAMLLALVRITYADDSKTNSDHQDLKRIEGVWTGSWGGGESDGTTIQPVLSRMVMRDGKIELAGFPGVSQMWGVVHIDPEAHVMKITSARNASSPSKVIEYRYTLTDKSLEMKDSDNVPITLIKRPLERDSVATVSLELMSAEGINDQGELLVTQSTELKVGRFSRPYYESSRLVLKTNGSVVFVVEEAGMKKISLDEARKQIKPSMVVSVVFQIESSPEGAPGIAQEVRQGIPRPDSEAGLKTLARALRPGTLVFLLPHQSLVAEP